MPIFFAISVTVKNILVLTMMEEILPNNLRLVNIIFDLLLSTPIDYLIGFHLSTFIFWRTISIEFDRRSLSVGYSTDSFFARFISRFISCVSLYSASLP